MGVIFLRKGPLQFAAGMAVISNVISSNQDVQNGSYVSWYAVQEIFSLALWSCKFFENIPRNKVRGGLVPPPQGPITSNVCICLRHHPYLVICRHHPRRGYRIYWRGVPTPPPWTGHCPRDVICPQEIDKHPLGHSQPAPPWTLPVWRHLPPPGKIKMTRLGHQASPLGMSKGGRPCHARSAWVQGGGVIAPAPPGSATASVECHFCTKIPTPTNTHK